MGSVLKIAAGICLGLLAFVLIVGAIVSAQVSEEERQRVAALKVAMDGMNRALGAVSSKPAMPSTPHMVLVDVGP